MASSSSSSCSSSSSSSSFSSCSSCSCSSSSCSSSSSYAGFTANRGDVSEGNFEILTQDGNHIIVNSGVAYDGYANRLAMDDRKLLSLDFSGITGSFAYLCVRRRVAPVLIDYQDHPNVILPKATKKSVEVEFYLSESVVKVNFDTTGGFAYYPPLDSNLIIDGLVLGRVYENASQEPSMVPWRSPYMAVKNGIFFPLNGFNLG